MNKIVDKLYFLFLMFFITVNFNSCILFQRSYYGYIIDFESQIVQENDNVLSVNVLYDEGDLRVKLRILITFYDGQWIVLSNVKKDQTNIIIDSINGYYICGFRRELNESDAIVERYVGAVDLIVVGRKLNINEIIKNFDVMAAYIDYLEEITDEILQSKNFDWFWSDGANSRKEIKRGYEIITFKKTSSEYIVLGYPPYQEEKEKWRSVKK